MLGIAKRIDADILPLAHSRSVFHRGGKEAGASGISRKGLEKRFSGGGERDEAFFL